MQRWSLDFVRDQLPDCRKFRVLKVVDDHSRFCLSQILDVSIPEVRVAQFLDALALRVGLPEEIILYDGPECTSNAIFDWYERTDLRPWFIEPSKPVQNAFVERFNGKFPDEYLTFIGSGHFATPAKNSANGKTPIIPSAHIRRPDTCPGRSS